MEFQQRGAKVEEELGGKRRATTEEWTSNKKRALSSNSASRDPQRFASTDIKLGSNLIDVELGRKQKWVHVRAICRKGKVKLMGGSSRNGSDMPI